MKKIILGLIALFIFDFAFAKSWHVGPARTYTTPSSVQSLVNDGDTIYIDGGIYQNDAVTWTHKNLKFIGLGTPLNPVILEYSGNIPNNKGIWVFQQPGVSDNPYIENITFKGAQVSDAAGGNGAGIRFQSMNLTVNKCKFEYCQDGILEGGSYSGSTVIIENSEFSHNGYNGTDNALVGYEHQIYISAQTDSLVVKNCYFHDVRNQGHSLKTRAQKSYILYNLIDEGSGNGSYEFDIAQGGMVVAVGNVIIQGVNDANHVIICLEAITNPLEELYFVNNTIINKFQGNVKFVNIIPSSGVTACKFFNNIFASVPSASNILFSGNIPSVIDTSNNIFVKNYAAFGFTDPSVNNYNLTSVAVDAIDKGVACGSADNGFPLTPLYMFINDSTSLSPRTVVGAAIDIGAYEYQDNSGINEAKINNDNLEINIFPNPSSAFLYVDMKNVREKIIKAQIYNVSGDLVYSENIANINSALKFDVSKFSDGMYFLRLLTNNKTLTQKFLVQHLIIPRGNK